MRRSAAVAALAAALVAPACGAGERGPEPTWSAPPRGMRGASSGTSAERYFPLVDGHIVHYVTTNEVGEQGLLVARVYRGAARAGELRFPAGTKRFAYTPEGVVLSDRGAFVLKEPLAIGTSWIGEHGGRAQISAVEVTVEVPAGRFSGCVQTLEERLGDQPVRYVSTFCPEVGLVLLEASSRSSYEQAALKSYGPPVQLGPDGLERMPVTPSTAPR